MTSYTVIDRSSGEMIDTGLSAADAARIVLTADSQEYSIREDADGGFTLWSRQQVANKGWSKTVIWSIATDRAEAEADIFMKVIAADWRGAPEVVTDEQYAEMIAAVGDE